MSIDSEPTMKQLLEGLSARLPKANKTVLRFSGGEHPDIIVGETDEVFVYNRYLMGNDWFEAVAPCGLLDHPVCNRIIFLTKREINLSP